MPQITRRFEFDYGHRVLGHEGKCRHLHGHRGRAEVTVSASELDDLGRVIDFSVIKEKVGSWIDEHWDHNLLLHPEDPLWALFNCERIDCRFAGGGMVPVGPDALFAGKEPYKMPDQHNEAQDEIVRCNPTAENMARCLYVVARNLLPRALKVIRVRLWETPNCSAEYPDPA